MKLSVVLSLLSLAATGMAAIGDSCASGYGTGTCKTDANCTGGFNVVGKCPNDPSSVKCCVPSTCSTPSGSGICRNTGKSCSGTYYSGYCPGPSDIKCCVTSSGGGDGGSNLPGLNAKQSAHARVIASVAKTNAVGNRGCKVAMATAMQESTMRVLANTGIPESYNYPHDGAGSDHDSVGLFQQRPKYWGTVKDCMDPKTSSQKFFTALKAVSGWQSMTIAKAAQSVQKSAYPDAYAKWETTATNICKVVYP
ncbi:hypothetical protein BJ508DRAFT_416722 [Ascobolus immersus RN42]|uniref:Uncharacterized protein n=1 Tax=Ascobolus immersus RN42 TaxID=1160509 RepID=A0A3N4HW57_ASCIM|nr:hypothetical protein BJ508DRAFT_416722 [Ascobolus immersus RN42]